MIVRMGGCTGKVGKGGLVADEAGCGHGGEGS
jgi:hypothetical protein